MTAVVHTTHYDRRTPTDGGCNWIVSPFPDCRRGTSIESLAIRGEDYPVIQVILRNQCLAGGDTTIGIECAHRNTLAILHNEKMAC